MLSRNLIAAAGNAAGGLSYWVARVQTPGIYETSIRSVINTDDNTIVCTNSQGTSFADKYFVELDYDGGLVSDSKYDRFTTNGNQITLCSVGGNAYNFCPIGNTFEGLITLDNTSASTLPQKVLTKASGVVSYSPAGTQRAAVNPTNNDIVIVADGFKDTYFGGFGTYYQDYSSIATYKPGTASLDLQRTHISGYEAVGYASRDMQVAKGSGDNYAVWWNSAAFSRHVFATYTNTSGTSTPFYNIKNTTYTANMKGKGIAVDSSNLVSAVGAVSTSQVWVFRGTVAGNYWPTVYYSFSHNTTLGYCSSAAMDSDGNWYILFVNGYLVKFSSSNTIEWCLSLDNTLVGNPPSGKEYLSEIKVETIDDTEFLLMSLAYPKETGVNYSWYIIKAPLDLNNYLGTYGNIQISNYSFSPSVSSNSISPTTNTNTVSSGAFGVTSSTVSNTSTTITVTTNDI